MLSLDFCFCAHAILLHPSKCFTLSDETIEISNTEDARNHKVQSDVSKSSCETTLKQSEAV